jgi:hypothetical protein
LGKEYRSLLQYYFTTRIGTAIQRRMKHSRTCAWTSLQIAQWPSPLVYVFNRIFSPICYNYERFYTIKKSQNIFVMIH